MCHPGSRQFDLESETKMKTTIQTKSAPPLFVGINILTSAVFVVAFKHSAIQLGSLPVWWIMLACLVFFVLDFIVKPILKWGDIELDQDKIRVREYPSREWTFEWDEIDGFGTKRLLFREYPTIQPKKVLVPKDPIVIRHQYKQSASEVSDTLNRYKQSRAANA